MKASSSSEKWKRRLSKRASKWYNWARRRFARPLATLLPSLSKRLHSARYRRAERKIIGIPERPRPFRPDFIIIGSPKCGTSWLQGALGQHPAIVVVPDEIEYFSSNQYYPVEWYYEHFARRLASTDKIRGLRTCVLGEKSAHYCSLPRERIKRIQQLLPDVRLILMARDPVARHWAHARKFFAKTQLRNPDMAVLQVPRNTLLAFFEHQRAVGEFSKIIENWSALFPPQQLLVLSQEKTLASPKTTYDAVLEHIGVPNDYDPRLITLMSRQTNQGPKVEMPQDIAEHLVKMYASEQRWLSEFFADRQFAYAA
jgi:Sulfotransferase domain